MICTTYYLNRNFTIIDSRVNQTLNACTGAGFAAPDCNSKEVIVCPHTIEDASY